MIAASTELVLQPGEWFFGTNHTAISTLLGSCVALTVWHPILHCGGMCHYLLPRSPKKDPMMIPSARYGHDALQFLYCAMVEVAPLSEFHVSCFGGAEIFVGNHNVGRGNVDIARQWMELHHIIPHRLEAGGRKGRKIRLDLNNGNIDVVLLQSYASSGDGHDH